ncbi:hypothetical protein [Dyadobacter sp. LHD-138]|uniref:hypothetical protein n=1 Tax=Dyadobacter sp. LHD-138 TaxID=3071413 RepID=UPI0027E174D0|nr:hypothetical protein [Dyadobacter sp. LHD-138]MDQ6477843.1 hypothetical protein [Dyadobacter sp. LHD-138]
MKKLLLPFALLVLLSACENNDISTGRKIYEKYLQKTLKDPESLVIHEEKVELLKSPEVKFTVDYGAKNGFGAMNRSTMVFETHGSFDYLTVNGKFTKIE